MNSERWQRADILFHDALERPPSEREAFLDAACGGDAELRSLIASLLGADARSDAPLAAALDRAVVDVSAALVPIGEDQRIGPYRILSEIGRGGMGTVYLAERDDDEYRQRVAIKVVRGLLSPDRVRRFRAERQILASLDHPNIARLVDGGTTAAGWPYLVMEFVDGTPIDRYAVDHALDVGARLRLFSVIAHAVSHAHQRLVVHRDLKPGNIVVTGDGVPKLLDFGIAKLLDADGEDDAVAMTATGMRMLTPEYASPEQVRGEAVTTATDVYALGLLLYELLTGHRAHRFGTRTAKDIEAVVCETTPAKPSTQAPGLDADLDAIVLTALHKDPARRYASVEAFAEDVGRSLSGVPILARPATWRYRASRFVGRHRWSVGTAAAFVIVLIGFSIVVSLQAARLARERDVAQRERDTARHVSDFLVEVFDVSDPSEARGNAVTARELLDRSAARIAGGLVGQPEVQSQLMDTIGRVYRALGLFEPASRIHEAALDASMRAFGPQTVETAARMEGLGQALRERGQYERAEALHREALAIRLARLEPPDAAIASAMNNLGLTISLRGQYVEAETLLRDAAAMWHRTLGDTDPQVAVALTNLSQLLRQRSRPAEAEPLIREAIAIRRKAFGDGPHPLTANVIMQLGQIVQEQGRLDEAEAPMREALAMRLEVFEPDHALLGGTYNNLAALLHDRGDYAAAEPMYRAAIPIYAARYGTDHPEYAVGLNNLASLLADTARTVEAEDLYRQALAIRRKALGAEHPAVARGLANLARTLLRNGKIVEADALARAALAMRQRLLAAGHVESAQSKVLVASIAGERGRLDEAVGLYRDAVATLRQRLPARHPALANALIEFATTLQRAGRAAEALPLVQEAVDIRRSRLPEGHPQRAAAEALLAKTHAAHAQGRP